MKPPHISLKLAVQCLVAVVSFVAFSSTLDWVTRRQVDGAPTVPSVVAIPEEVHYICVVDQDDQLVSMVQPFPFRPTDPETFKAQLRNAVNLAGRSMNRPDVIDASASIQLVDNPILPLDRKPRPRRNPNATGGCHTVCTCATPIFCATVSPDPITEAIRRTPNPPGGSICGCGGGCGTCEKCKVVCSG